jgi:hypothetical protein
MSVTEYLKRKIENAVLGPPDDFTIIQRVRGEMWQVDSYGNLVKKADFPVILLPGQTVEFGKNGRHIITMNKII